MSIGGITDWQAKNFNPVYPKLKSLKYSADGNKMTRGMDMTTPVTKRAMVIQGDQRPSQLR